MHLTIVVKIGEERFSYFKDCGVSELCIDNFRADYDMFNPLILGMIYSATYQYLTKKDKVKDVES